MTNNLIDGVKMLTLVFLLILSGLLSDKSITVNAIRMYNQPGETRPVTVEEAIGTDFNITCYMNPKTFPEKNSSCLHFVDGRTNLDMPRENIVIINSTTIVYMEHNATEQQSEYRCKCGKHAIMETKVFVGSPPREVKDFSCRSYDFEYMICNFTKPSNPILTTYNVSYYLTTPYYIYQPHCYYSDRFKVECNISLSESYQEKYHYKIESMNALVKANSKPLTQEFEINNFKIMIPSKPGTNLRIDNLTVDNIKLAWQMKTYEKYRPIGLQWEIILQPEKFSEIIPSDVPKREYNEMILSLELPYAFWSYKLKMRVRVKSPSAVWSEQFVYTFRSEARLPQGPPRLDPGSFYVDTSETDITVYWEELLPHYYNGDNFTYSITSAQPDGRLTNLKPHHQEKNLAKFKFQKELYYEFHVRSKNHIGESTEASSLIVYPTHQRNRKEFSPQNIQNVYHDNNRSYTLTWSKPKNLTGLSGYTVFWCYRKHNFLKECKESIHFKQIPADQLNFTTPMQNPSEEGSLNLAVSANYYKFNTGLHWAECSMDVAHADFGKMEPELQVSTNTIQLQWSVEGVCTTILSGFNITYCEVANNATAENATCLKNHSITLKANNTEKKYIINNLKPFTMYKVSMFMYWNNKKSPPSVPQIVRTAEGAPSPPRQLRVESKTNTSAIIKWLEPTEPNGEIRKYIIMLNNDQIEVNATNLTYHLKNLECFTAYKVYVMAETVQRSQTSNDVHFTTDIGVPSPPSINTNNVKNGMQWNKPTKPSGPIDFYEVRVTQMQNDKIIREYISIIFEATSCNLSTFPTCIGPDYKTTFDVRAVNVVTLDGKQSTNVASYNNNFNNNEDNKDLECIAFNTDSEEYKNRTREYRNAKKYALLKSSWQTTFLYSCSPNYFTKMATIALSVVGMSLVVLATLYTARKKYNKMANINCTLPAGLETYFTKEAGVGFPGDFGNNVHTIKDTRLAEDQWISAAHMHDYNFRNEHHHLLASLGNDSGYLGGCGVGGVGNNSGDAFNEHILANSLETANINEDNALQNEGAEDYEKEHLKESCQSTSSSADSLVESTEGSECNNLELEHSPLAIFPDNNGYIKQSMLPPWQTFNNHDDYDDSTQLSIIPAATTNGYITVQNLNHTLAKQTNNPNDFNTNPGGYVLQQDLQNFFNNRQPISNNPTVAIPVTINSIPTNENITHINSNGYTTLESLNKLNLPPLSLGLQNENNQQETQIPSVSNTNQLPPNSTDANADIDVSSIAKTGGISGYVTQQDLNLFAQHQHNH